MQQQVSYHCDAHPPVHHHCISHTVERGNILVGRHVGWPKFFLPSCELKNCETSDLKQRGCLDSHFLNTILKKITRQTTIQKKTIWRSCSMVYSQNRSLILYFLIHPDYKSFSNVANTALYSHTGKKHFEFSMRMKSAGNIRSSTSVLKRINAVWLSALQRPSSVILLHIRTAKVIPSSSV